MKRMHNLWQALVVSVLVIAAPVAAWQQTDVLNTLTGINQAPLTPDRYALQLNFEKAVAAPVVRAAQNPLRNEFLLRYTNTDLPLGTFATPAHPLIESVQLEQQRDDLLVSIRTRQPLQHLVSRSGRELSITLVAATDTPSAGASAEVEQAQQVRHELQDIDFSRAEGGAALITLTSSHEMSGEIQPELRHEIAPNGERKLTWTLYNTRLPTELLYLLDVSEFDTPIRHIETFREGSNTRIEIVGKTEFAHFLEQNGDELALMLRPQAEEGVAALTAEGNSQPISLNFQNIPVRQLLQILADENELNLVASDAVSGTITLRLENVPWTQALNTILQVKGLDKRIEGNILIVGPADELAEREAKNLAANAKIADLTPMTASYIQINYAKAADIAMLLRNEDTNLLSERGAVTVDERTNTLLIRDTESQIQSIKDMVAVLDVPVKQVMIEARMVTVRDNISDELGIRWGFLAKPAATMR